MTLNKELSDKQMTGIGEADDPMFTIRANGTQHAVAMQQAIAFKPGQSADARSLGESDEVACTLEAGGGGNNRQAVALAQAVGVDLYNTTTTGDVHATLTTIGGNGRPACLQAVATQQPVREVAATIGQRMRGLDDSCADNLLLAPSEAQLPAQPIAFHHNAQACQLPSEHRDTRVTDTLTVSQNAAVAFEPRYYTRDNKTGGKPSDVSALKADASKAGDSSPHVATSLAVRRLTPRECERLQGFPDDYTAIAYRGKPAADGPRYKAMGNSMAVNCMAWIGERIAAVNARIR
jgi:hypothetical protein